MRKVVFTKFTVLFFVLISSTQLMAKKNKETTLQLDTSRSTQCRWQDVQTNKPKELSLLNAVCMAVKRHPAVASAVSAHHGQLDMIDAAKAGYYPQVGVSMQSGKASSSDNSYALSPKLSAQQVIYDFGKTGSQVDLAEGQSKRQEANVLSQVDDITVQTVNAIISIQRFQAIEAKTKSMIEGIKKVVDVTNSRANAGLNTQSDAIQAKSRLSAAEASLLDIQTQLRKARINLNILIGKGFEDVPLAPITDSLFNKSLFQLKVDPGKIPSIIAANADLSIAQAQLSGSDAELYPTVSIVGSTEKTLRGTNANTGKEKGTYNYVGLSVNQTLFNGGGRTARKRSAAQLVNSANYSIEAAMLEIDSQLESLKEYILGTENRLTILEMRKQSINETRVLYQDQYTLGSRPVLDLLNAEQEMYQAEVDEVNAIYDMWIYYMEYIMITGNTRRLFNLDAVVQESLEK